MTNEIGHGLMGLGECMGAAAASPALAPVVCRGLQGKGKRARDHVDGEVYFFLHLFVFKLL